MDIHIPEFAGLGIVGDAMCTRLGILDVVDGNPVLHDFDYAFRYPEGEFV